MGYFASAPLKASEINVLVYYQPSYFSSYGEKSGVVRLESLFSDANEALSEQGADVTLNMLDFTPMTTIPDSLPYYAYEDEDGETQGGANDYASLYIYNSGYDENDIYEKWTPDLVLYLRDYRDEGVPGAAAQNGDYSVLLAQNTDDDNRYYLHFLGHNLGANHEYDDVGQTDPIYAHPYTCGDYQTIMYTTFTDNTMMRFSLPELVVDDEVCGDVESANNLQVIEDNASIAAERGSDVKAWLTIVSDESTSPVGKIGFSSNEYTESEGSAAQIVVNRVDGDTGTLVGHLSSSDITAIAGTDYDKVKQRLSQIFAWLDFEGVNENLVKVVQCLSQYSPS